MPHVLGVAALEIGHPVSLIVLVECDDGTRRDIRLQSGLELEKALRGSVSIKGSGQYVQSNNDNAYWSITSSLKKDF